MTVTLSDEKKNEMLGKLAQDIWNDQVQPLTRKYQIDGHAMMNFLSMFVAGALICFVKPQDFETAVQHLHDQVEGMLDELVSSDTLDGYVGQIQ